MRKLARPDVLGADHPSGSDIALRGAHARDALAAVAQQPRDFHALAQRRAEPACVAGERGERQVGVRIARFRFPADAGDVFELAERQDALRFGGVDLARFQAGGALDGERFAHGPGARTFRRDTQEPAAMKAALRLRIVEVGRKVAEHVEAGARERDVLRHRIVRAYDARRLRRRAAAELAAIEQQHARRTEPREMVGDRHADHAPADHDCVVAFHDRLSSPRRR